MLNVILSEARDLMPVDVAMRSSASRRTMGQFARLAWIAIIAYIDCIDCTGIHG